MQPPHQTRRLRTRSSDIRHSYRRLVATLSRSRIVPLSAILQRTCSMLGSTRPWILVTRSRSSGLPDLNRIAGFVEFDGDRHPLFHPREFAFSIMWAYEAPLFRIMSCRPASAPKYRRTQDVKIVKLITITSVHSDTQAPQDVRVRSDLVYSQHDSRSGQNCSAC